MCQLFSIGFRLIGTKLLRDVEKNLCVLVIHVAFKYIMISAFKGPKTNKTASILKWIETNKVKKECYFKYFYQAAVAV